MCVFKDESGTAESSGVDDSSQERFIGPLPRDSTAGCSGDYSSPSYSYSSILSKSDTGEVWSPIRYMISLLLYNPSWLLCLVVCPHCRLRGLGQPSYDLLFKQSSTNTVHDPGVQKCTLQVRSYVPTGLCGVSTGNISTVKIVHLCITLLFSWEFEESEEEPVTSIPYQLQRLFVLLQTSKKRAIETTDVTRSFGWDSSEGELLWSPMTRLTWLVCVFVRETPCASASVHYTFCAFVFSLATTWRPGTVQGHVWCPGAKVEADWAGKRKQKLLIAKNQQPV